MPTKKKVCFVVSSLVNEGPVRVMLNIIKYVNYEKFEVSVITLKDEPEYSLIDSFGEFPISIHQLKLKSRIRNIPVLHHRLNGVLHAIDPDIVHTHCPRSIFLVCIIRGRFKKFHTVHNFPGLVDRALYGNVKGAIVEKLMKWAFKRIDRPIACGVNLQRQLLSKLKINTIAISNGVDFSAVLCDNNEKESMKKRLGLNLDKQRFLFVGRFSNEKNPLFLIEAFKAESFKHFELLMLGDGPLLAEARERASSNVNIVGFKTNVRDYLIASDYFVSSSVTEGMPNSVLEAMSVGLPLLLSEVPAHKEIIQVCNNRVGYLYKLNDVADFEKSVAIITKEFSITDKRKGIVNSFQTHYTAKQMSLNYQMEYSLIK